MNKLMQLALQTKQMEQIDTIKDEFGITKVYGIETEEYILKVWNSSNPRSFNHQSILKDIVMYLVMDKTYGSFSDGWCNEIMYEIIMK